MSERQRILMAKRNRKPDETVKWKKKTIENKSDNYCVTPSFHVVKYEEKTNNRFDDFCIDTATQESRLPPNIILRSDKSYWA